MGAAIGIIGAVASLAQTGIGMYGAHKAKIAQERAMEEARNRPKADNALESMRIGNEAYAAQEARNSQTEANLVAGLSDQGVAAALGGIPLVQQQAMAANADITAKKAADLQQIEQAKRMEQQRINTDYLNYQRGLDQMELQGAGAARAQNSQMAWQGVSGLTSVAGSMANTYDQWGNKIENPASGPTTMGAWHSQE